MQEEGETEIRRKVISEAEWLDKFDFDVKIDKLKT